MTDGPPVPAGPASEARPDKPDAAVVRDALGVGIAVGLSGFAFGVTSAGSGLSLLQTCVLSLLVFTGASQFALVGALAAGGNPYTAAAGAFFLGVRNAFYGLRLSQLLALPRAVRPFAAHWVIDETTAVTLPQPTRRAARIGFTVTGLTLYVLWNLTTLVGALGAEALGDTRRVGPGRGESRGVPRAARADAHEHHRTRHGGTGRRPGPDPAARTPGGGARPAVGARRARRPLPHGADEEGAGRREGLERNGDAAEEG